jgi:basic endochitinase B
MNNTNWKTRIATVICAILWSTSSYAQHSNLANLLNETQWNTLFPKRAGTYGVHPQGYVEDFYSYNHLVQAAEEMSDYFVEIKLKPGVWGQLITITKKSTQFSYLYSDVESWWHSNTTPETIIHVDFKDFLNSGSEHNNKRELAAFLAHISKETTGGWQFPVGGGLYGDYALWGLYFVHEVGYTDQNAAGAYSQEHIEFPPNPAVGYYGRGPIQLSWNYNYGQLSKFLYNDKNVLLDHPDFIQQNGVLAFQSAIWFWMMPQCPKPSCHQVMHDMWEPKAGEYSSDKMYKKGFAHTNNIINGGLECRATSSAIFTEKVVLRSELYSYYLSLLGFDHQQIASENTGDYSTLCYESITNTMEDYLHCFISSTLTTEVMEHTQVFVYPNPAVNTLYIRHASIIDKVELIHSLGQVHRMSYHNSSPIELNIKGLTSGVYIVNIYSEDKVFTKRIVVCH